MSKTIFIKARAGMSKGDQKPYNYVTIAVVDDSGKVSIYELWANNGYFLPNQDSLRFGDEVKPTYLPSDYPGGRSSLGSLEVISNSPYFN